MGLGVDAGTKAPGSCAGRWGLSPVAGPEQDESVSLGAGSGQGTPSHPSGLGAFLAAAHLPSSQLAPRLLTRNGSLRTAMFTHPES